VSAIAVTSVDSLEPARDYPPMPALQSADHANLGRWVGEMVQTSDENLHRKVEQLRNAVHKVELQVESLATRSDYEYEERKHLSKKLDDAVADLNEVVGRLSVMAPVASAERKETADKAQAGNLALAALINERTLPLFALLIIVVILGVFIYAKEFGDESIDHKLDRVPGLRHEENQP